MNKRGMNAADDQPAGAEAGPAGEPPQGADRDFVTALARGLAVIQAFTNQQRQLSIAQISYRTGITRAAVRRNLLNSIPSRPSTLEGSGTKSWAVMA
jgi:IclR family transcriptional regulator, pca regulon regulatory protein